jgi:hypothetical protein
MRRLIGKEGILNLSHPHPDPPLPSPNRGGKGRIKEGLGEVYRKQEEK